MMSLLQCPEYYVGYATLSRLKRIYSDFLRCRHSRQKGNEMLFCAMLELEFCESRY